MVCIEQNKSKGDTLNENLLEIESVEKTNIIIKNYTSLNDYDIVKYVMCIYPDDSIETIKNKIYEKTNIHPNFQYLYMKKFYDTSNVVSLQLDSQSAQKSSKNSQLSSISAQRSSQSAQKSSKNSQLSSISAQRSSQSVLPGSISAQRSSQSVLPGSKNSQSGSQSVLPGSLSAQLSSKSALSGSKNSQSGSKNSQLSSISALSGSKNSQSGSQSSQSGSISEQSGSQSSQSGSQSVNIDPDYITHKIIEFTNKNQDWTEPSNRKKQLQVLLRFISEQIYSNYNLRINIEKIPDRVIKTLLDYEISDVYSYIDFLTQEIMAFIMQKSQKGGSNLPKDTFVYPLGFDEHIYSIYFDEFNLNPSYFNKISNVKDIPVNRENNLLQMYLSDALDLNHSDIYVINAKNIYDVLVMKKKSEEEKILTFIKKLWIKIQSVKSLKISTMSKKSRIPKIINNINDNIKNITSGVIEWKRTYTDPNSMILLINSLVLAIKGGDKNFVNLKMLFNITVLNNYIPMISYINPKEVQPIYKLLNNLNQKFTKETVERWIANSVQHMSELKKMKQEHSIMLILNNDNRFSFVYVYSDGTVLIKFQQTLFDEVQDKLNILNSIINKWNEYDYSLPNTSGNISISNINILSNINSKKYNNISFNQSEFNLMIELDNKNIGLNKYLLSYNTHVLNDPNNINSYKFIYKRSSSYSHYDYQVLLAKLNKPSEISKNNIDPNYELNLNSPRIRIKKDNPNDKFYKIVINSVSNMLELSNVIKFVIGSIYKHSNKSDSSSSDQQFSSVSNNSNGNSNGNSNRSVIGSNTQVSSSNSQNIKQSYIEIINAYKTIPFYASVPLKNSIPPSRSERISLMDYISTPPPEIIDKQYYSWSNTISSLKTTGDKIHSKYSTLIIPSSTDHSKFDFYKNDMEQPKGLYSRGCNKFRVPVVYTKNPRTEKSMKDMKDVYNKDDKVLEYRGLYYTCPIIWCPRCERSFTNEQIKDSNIPKTSNYFKTYSKEESSIEAVKRAICPYCYDETIQIKQTANGAPLDNGRFSQPLDIGVGDQSNKNRTIGDGKLNSLISWENPNIGHKNFWDPIKNQKDMSKLEKNSIYPGMIDLVKPEYLGAKNPNIDDAKKWLAENKNKYTQIKQAYDKGHRICSPCCFASSLNKKGETSIIDKCKNVRFDKTEIQQTHLMNNSYDITPMGRYRKLPFNVYNFLSNYSELIQEYINIPQQQRLINKKTVFRYGVKDKTFLGSVIEAINETKNFDKIIKNLRTHLNLDDDDFFLSLKNGEIYNMFKNDNITDDKNIDLRYARQNFKNFIQKNENLNEIVLWDYISRKNILHKDGVNIIILKTEMETSDDDKKVDLLFPYGENITNIYEKTKKTILIMKLGNIYEPILVHKDISSILNFKINKLINVFNKNIKSMTFENFDIEKTRNIGLPINIVKPPKFNEIIKYLQEKLPKPPHINILGQLVDSNNKAFGILIDIRLQSKTNYTKYRGNAILFFERQGPIKHEDRNINNKILVDDILLDYKSFIINQNEFLVNALTDKFKFGKIIFKYLNTNNHIVSVLSDTGDIININPEKYNDDVDGVAVSKIRYDKNIDKLILTQPIIEEVVDGELWKMKYDNEVYNRLLFELTYYLNKNRNIRNFINDSVKNINKTKIKQNKKIENNIRRTLHGVMRKLIHIGNYTSMSYNNIIPAARQYCNKLNTNKCIQDSHCIVKKSDKNSNNTYFGNQFGGANKHGCIFNEGTGRCRKNDKDNSIDPRCMINVKTGRCITNPNYSKEQSVQQRSSQRKQEQRVQRDSQRKHKQSIQRVQRVQRVQQRDSQRKHKQSVQRVQSVQRRQSVQSVQRDSQRKQEPREQSVQINSSNRNTPSPIVSSITSSVTSSKNLTPSGKCKLAIKNEYDARNLLERLTMEIIYNKNVQNNILNGVLNYVVNPNQYVTTQPKKELIIKSNINDVINNMYSINYKTGTYWLSSPSNNVSLDISLNNTNNIIKNSNTKKINSKNITGKGKSKDKVSRTLNTSPHLLPHLGLNYIHRIQNKEKYRHFKNLFNDDSNQWFIQNTVTDGNCFFDAFAIAMDSSIQNVRISLANNIEHFIPPEDVRLSGWKYIKKQYQENLRRNRSIVKFYKNIKNLVDFQTFIKKIDDRVHWATDDDIKMISTIYQINIIVVIKKRDEDRGNVQCYQTFPGRDYIIILWDGTYGTGHYELIGYENIDRERGTINKLYRFSRDKLPRHLFLEFTDICRRLYNNQTQQIFTHLIPPIF
jgi:hypothetical protein